MNNITLAAGILADMKEMGFSDAMLVAVAGIIVVLLELALLTVLILGLSRLVRAIEYKLLTSTSAPAAPATTPAAAPVAAAVAAPASSAPVAVAPAMNVKLEGVDDPTAAVIMAIVSNESGIPLERLNFKSIKKVEG